MAAIPGDFQVFAGHASGDELLQLVSGHVGFETKKSGGGGLGMGLSA
jgi:hypothetical protein